MLKKFDIYNAHATEKRINLYPLYSFKMLTVN